MTVQLPLKQPQQERLMDSVQETGHQGAGNSLIDAIPLKLVLFLAGPYLAGKSSQEAIEKAHHLYDKDKFCGTLDILGEDAANLEDCERYLQTYLSLIDEVSAKQIQVENPRKRLTVSMKPSMFSERPPAPGKESERALEAAFDRISKIVDYANERSIDITLEAEDHRWANFHIETYIALFKAGYKNLGTVLQSRLFRTEKDIRRFEEGMRVRLVIGIYQEPPQIALTDKTEMKNVLVDYAADLASKGVYLEIASHDTRLIDNFFTRVAIPMKIDASMMETQFLLGVPRTRLQKSLIDGSYFSRISQGLPEEEARHALELAKSGVIVRMYLPYGKDRVAGPYCRRRLKNNPNMMVYGIKNVLGLE